MKTKIIIGILYLILATYIAINGLYFLYTDDYSFTMFCLLVGGIILPIFVFVNVGIVYLINRK